MVTSDKVVVMSKYVIINFIVITLKFKISILLLDNLQNSEYRRRSCTVHMYA